jgi:hypothetical protein
VWDETRRQPDAARTVGEPREQGVDVAMFEAEHERHERLARGGELGHQAAIGVRERGAGRLELDRSSLHAVGRRQYGRIHRLEALLPFMQRGYR